jgi:hypothetical protein
MENVPGPSLAAACYQFAGFSRIIQATVGVLKKVKEVFNQR